MNTRGTLRRLALSVPSPYLRRDGLHCGEGKVADSGRRLNAIVEVSREPGVVVDENLVALPPPEPLNGAPVACARRAEADREGKRTVRLLRLGLQIRHERGRPRDTVGAPRRRRDFKRVHGVEKHVEVAILRLTEHERVLAVDIRQRANDVRPAPALCDGDRHLPNRHRVCAHHFADE